MSTEERRPFSFDRPLHAAMARLTAGISPAALTQSYTDWAQCLLFSPDKPAALAGNAGRKWTQYVDYTLRAGGDPNCEACIVPLPYDKRFAGEAWQRQPFAAIYQGFLLTQQWWHNATTGVEGVSKHHEDVVGFVARQLPDAISPANFPLTNPEVLNAAIRQGGMNFARGIANIWKDWRRAVSGTRPVGAEGFQVGRNMAIAPGKVVLRNRLIELIQYAPATDKVCAEPVLIVPAWIMKYYILDLSPNNPLVKYLVERGYTVFVVSWKSPTGEDRELGMEDYRELGVMGALDAIATVVPKQQIHAVGYCLGSPLLAIAATAMARDGDDRLKSLTLFAAQTGFTEAGELMLFIDEAQVSFLTGQFPQGHDGRAGVPRRPPDGGYHAGIVSPPGHPHRHHQIATHKEDENYVDPDAWQQTAVHHEGSWWPCWQDWLVEHSSDQAPPPPMGAPQNGYAALGAAPGTYVLEP